MSLNLTNLKMGDIAVITALNTKNIHYRQKLLSSGLFPGMEFKVSRIAPFGDPIQITLAIGTALSLTKDKINLIKIDLVK